MFGDCAWLNEPAEWSARGADLVIVTDAKANFWRETH
jgi:regulation of enolase protein 1 (concanavalin A-like superfamily)